MSTIAAYIFLFCTVLGILFQFALALGAPWGEMAMGGKFPGKFPPPLRMLAVVQAFVLAGMAAVVVARAGMAFDSFFELSKTAIWFVCAVCLVSAILNIITPSKKERVLWGPIAVVLFVSVLLVALC